MSLLDLAGQLLGAGRQGANQNLLTEVLGLVNNQPGGLAGLVQEFQQGGLGEVVNSWVRTGQNLPVSANQIQSVLGDERVVAMAAKLGISPAEVNSHLAQLLPAVVDHLTPNGQMPSGSAGQFDLTSLLKGFTG